MGLVYAVLALAIIFAIAAVVIGREARRLDAEGSPQALAEAASVAQAWCSEAYRSVTAETVQLHGGIGFTWEHDAHLYFKRAKSSELLLGDPTYHRELLAQRIGI